MTTESTGAHIVREARLEWVPIPAMAIAPLAQRELKQYRVDKLAANLDLEQLGTPTVNKRGVRYYIIDGQHRVEALKKIGYGDQSIQCWMYEGLTEAQEAEKFLKLNDVLTVDAFPKFTVAVHAGRPEETAVNNVVRKAGLHVGSTRQSGSVRAVATLTRIYRQTGEEGLARTLRIVHDSFGDAGLDAAVIAGVGLLCQRFNGSLDEERAISQFASIKQGVNGLLQQAAILKNQTGRQMPHCVAAAAIEFYNRGQRAKRLPSWWKAQEDN